MKVIIALSEFAEYCLQIGDSTTYEALNKLKIYDSHISLEFNDYPIKDVRCIGLFSINLRDWLKVGYSIDITPTYEYDKGKVLYYFCTKETTDRQYNAINFCPGERLEEITLKGSLMYESPKMQQLEKHGYHLKPKKHEIFISYSHKDMEIVNKIEKRLTATGISVWKDTQEIQFGDCLTEKIDEGIRKSDMYIICFSKHTRNALYAFSELKTLFNQFMVYREQGRRVIPIKLDETAPRDILMGFSNYKYFDYHEKQNIEELLIFLKKEFNIV